MNMLTCYIIDDEPHAIKSLVDHIEKTPLLKLVGTNENPLDALTFFQNTCNFPDILFLDIDMPLLSGIELASMVSGKTNIVLTTAHPQFALDAFELEVSDYLLKPISLSRFLKCINKLNSRLLPIKGKEQITEEDNFVYIQSEGKGKFIKIYFDEILMIESKKNYIDIITTARKYLTYLTLTEIESKLPSNFLRVNKSYVVNTDKISHVEGNEIFLAGQKESVPVGTSYKESFSNYMKNHLIKTKRSSG